MLPLEDIEAIRALTHLYALKCDTCQLDDLVDTFCNESPSFKSVANPVVSGREALRSYYERAFGPTTHQIHLISNHLIDGNGDEASGICYFLSRGVTRDGTIIELYGAYHDEYVRTEDGWRFRSRRTESLLPYEPPALTREWERHLWGLAETLLADASVDPPTDEQIRKYWTQLLEANADLLETVGSPDDVGADQIATPPPA